jgi:hypothetical protein
MGGVGGFSAIGVASAAIGAAAGSAASQVVGMAAGVVDDFSWKAVAQSALSAGVTAGVGGALHTAGILSSASTASAAGNATSNGISVSGNGAQVAGASESWIATAGKAALSSGLSAAATQAIQGKWSWRDIAANAVGSAAGSVAGSAVGEALKNYEVGAFASRMASSFVGSAAADQVRATDPNYTRASTSSMFVSSVGNAIGESLVDAITPNDRDVFDSSYRNEMDRESDNATAAREWQDSYFHRNGADIDSDNAAVDRRRRDALYGLASSGPVRLGGVFANSDSGALPAGTAASSDASPQSRFPSADVVARGVDASGRPWAEYDSGATTHGVLTPVIEAHDLPLAARPESVNPFSLVTSDYHVEPGLVSRYYQGQVAQFSDSGQPWYVRSLAFVNATLVSPVMLLEEGGRGIMNVPYAGSQVGQHAAIFNEATDVDTKVLAGLNMVKFGSEGLVNAYAGGVLGRQVYVQAQDEAVSYWLKQQFDGDARRFNEVYTSAADGTRRLGYTFEGVSGYRVHNTEVMATKAGEYMSLERPLSPADAIEQNALSPLWGNSATELYQVTTRSGFYFKGQVAPQSCWSQGSYFDLGGGNTQVFMPAQPNPLGGYPIAPWAPGLSKKVPYGD